MRKHFRIAALALLGLAAVTTAQAQFPRTISYQGIVADATGTPLTGNHQMTLSLYTTPTGGTPVYSETHSNVTLVRGLYNITIGSVTPIPATLSFNQAYYLGVTLDGGTELPQRTALTAVPYALYADTANASKTSQTATRANSAALADDLAPTANVVRSLNGQAGELEIIGGGSTTVTRTGNTITIFSRDTSGSGGVSPITSVQPLDRSITVQNFFGPNVGIKIRENGVNTEQLADNAVITPKIIDEAITTAKLANFSVTTSKLVDGAVTTSKIANLAITNALLAANAVTTDKIMDGTIQTVDLADGSVTNPKLAPNAVTSDKIFDGTIQTVDLADGSVTNPKLAANAVTTDKIMDGQVQTNDIANLNVTNAKLAADAVTTDKIQDGQVQTNDIANLNVTNGKLAADAVTTDKILDLTVGTNDLANLAVTNGKIGANAVDAAKISTAGATTNGQALMYNGSITPVWGNPIASGINLPYSATVNSASTLWDLTNTGTGAAGSFTINNAANSVNALTGQSNGAGAGISAINTGTGKAGNFLINNAANNQPSLDASTNGTGPAVLVTNSGTGNGGTFVINNAASGGTGISVTTNGTGMVGSFTNTNAANANNAVFVTTNGAGPALTASNTGTGRAGNFVITNAANTNPVVAGFTLGTGNAGNFQISNVASTADALLATTTGTGRAIHGRRAGGSGIALGQTEAIRGDNTDGPGVAGTANTAVGIYGTSTATHGVWGVSVTAATAGVLGRNDVVNGFGVWGQSFGGGIGVYGTSQTGHASQFEITNAASTGDAVRAIQNGLGRGVYGLINNTSNIVAAIRGETNGGGYGVFGQATGNGNAGFFQISNAASTSSVMNVTTNGIGSGVTVQLTNASNGARGLDVLQAGVGPGVFATSAGGNAVWGITSSISAAGVIGDNTFGEAVVGRNRGGNGVGAVVGRNDSSGYGVRGFNTKNGFGVLGQAGISGGTGVGGRFENVNAANTTDVLQVVTNSAGNSARFTGNVVINGNLTVSGTVAKGGGSFKIDHPLDPENKYLYHSFVESPDMLNIYNGTIVLDGNGEAVVEMPEWFQAVNGDYRYQLTCIGAFAPVYIAEEIADNRFKIAGGKPGMKISWEVTGVRHDPFSRQHRIPVEEDKAPEDRGRYLHPDAYNQPMEMQIGRLPVEPAPSVRNGGQNTPSVAPVDPNVAKRTPTVEPQPAKPVGN